MAVAGISRATGREQSTLPVKSTGVSTADEMQPLHDPQFAKPLDDLEKLLSQSRRAFLLGAGCSMCAGLPEMAKLTDEVRGSISKGLAEEALRGLIANFDGCEKPTIEDYMSELVDLISIAERRQTKSCKDATVSIAGKKYTVDELLDVLAEIKATISRKLSPEAPEISCHRAFIRAIHGDLQSGKANTDFPTDYFTLNYDPLLEDALSLERVLFSDGFNGGATGWWDPDSYDRARLQARVFKLHGSIDWCCFNGDSLPRRTRTQLELVENIERVLIWPAASKYRETQRNPYAQIMDRFRSALRPIEGSEVVLTICGYSFGDSHINLEIERALVESDKRLTVVILTDSEQPSGKIGEWVDDLNLTEQIRIYARRGFFHGDDKYYSAEDLPWWKFEVLTRLMGGER